MPVAHADDATTFYRRDAPLRVARTEPSHEHAMSQLQLLAILQNLVAPLTQPFTVGGREAEWQPVRKVDEVFIDYNTPGHFAGELIVTAGEVRAGVMRVACICFFRSSARYEETVAERAQCLAQRFVLRVEAVVCEH